MPHCSDREAVDATQADKTPLPGPPAASQAAWHLCRWARSPARPAVPVRSEAREGPPGPWPPSRARGLRVPLAQAGLIGGFGIHDAP